ncbi:SLOG family protein [Kitasatospora sp. NPDC048239]|uniref:SLOG family protein n=1 Tax=Kitasatospora sp. NPDC048239 TaxID=3364046 RepID=UPI00371F49A1
MTGSRSWSDRSAVITGLDLVAEEFDYSGLVVVHGACPTGVDSMAAAWARVRLGRGVREERWPADWARFGRSAGPRRNQVMVDRGAAVCVAFPLGRSVGTRDCMRRAAAAGIRVDDFGAQR